MMSGSNSKGANRRVEMKARTLVLLALFGCGGSEPRPLPSTTPRAEDSAALVASASVAPVDLDASAAPDVVTAATGQYGGKWAFPDHFDGAPYPHGAVTSDCALATKVGLDVLEHGGNAVDAAVATAFALAVAYPTAGNLAGGGFAVLRFGKDGESAQGAARSTPDERALDFRETAPAVSTRDMFVGAKDGGPRMGWRSMATPASVAGLWALHQAKGKKPWKDVVAPAIAMARDGFVVSDAFLDEITQQKDRLAKNPDSAALFLPGGAPPVLGSTWKNPDLAGVLERVAKDGPKGFYEGPTAKAIVSEMKAHGGLVTQADLSGYRAKWRAPLVFTYRGARVVAMPPPSSGGVTLAMAAHILEGFDLPHEAWHSPAEVHDLAEALRRAFAARNARLGDPDFIKNPLGELLSPGWADAQRATIHADKATPSSEIKSLASPQDGPHTTNLCVVDADGNAVALTTTLNWFFGNGITIAGTGMIMNNEMDDFASIPGTANGYGLVQAEPNAIAPKKRMLSSMSPVVVTGADGNVELVTGGAGGPRIITSVLDVMSNVLDHGMDPVAAVDAPRFHMQHLPDVLGYEKNGLDAALRTPLEAMGYTLKEFGHLATTNAIGRAPAPGTGWIPAADPRRAGSLGTGW
jgi:gamma-glutamyltranspeptidase/glutathione hydrolase